MLETEEPQGRGENKPVPKSLGKELCAEPKG